jgi:hypothetical protein
MKSMKNEKQVETLEMSLISFEELIEELTGMPYQVFDKRFNDKGEIKNDESNME